ncbi:hypothetical protein J2Z19_003237 [Ensifer adhaerens]|uniref:Uncharacterized protein n=1 Tax=Ensifer adhaerens TaxID=106592 RepID=A0ACC5SXC7_ENSAD|nr:hypothetical protein [Ensifer adhaerens]MBP1873522.1 hypothetical protein [Ensifer adhaerens]
MSVSEAWMFRVKAAQRDLIEACGGIRRVERRFNYGKSTVGRWNDASDPTLMPLGAIVALETDCGIPYVTGALAEASGRRLTDPDEDRVADVCVMTTHAELLRHTAELANGMAIAISDSRVTPTEAQTIDRIAASMQNAMNDMRAALAAIKAKGGSPAGLRVVGDE